MKTIAIISAVAAAALFTGAASADTTVPVGPFHSVSIEGMGHVTFIHGDRQRVVLKAGDTGNTQIYVKDGSLVFKSCPSKGWFGGDSCPWNYRMEAVVTTPALDAVEIDGSGKIDAQDGFPQQAKLDVEINGSGAVDLANIPAASSAVSISGSGKVRVTAHAKLAVDIAGSGEVIYGGSPEISQSISGSGVVKSAR
jgi:hypothetical protein